jgi:hypothetical protein
MGVENIEALKKTLGINQSNSNEATDKYLNLVDLVFMEKRGYVENYNDDKDEMVWSFDDGTIIRLSSYEIVEFMSLILEADPVNRKDDRNPGGFFNMN